MEETYGARNSSYQSTYDLQRNMYDRIKRYAEARQKPYEDYSQNKS